MQSRMNRYQEDQKSSTATINKRASRTTKNQDLYQDFNRNSKLTEFMDVTEGNVVDLSAVQKNMETRENYQKMKGYREIIQPIKVKRELEEYNTLYPEENKIYDINSILEEAKKNREIKDDLEQKRNLKNTEYNILAGLNREELEKYRALKQKRIQELQKEESDLKSIIDTITSKTLASDVNSNKDLLSDLMPTSAIDTVITPPKEETIDKTQSLTKTNMQAVDRSFYTKSMDLTDEDFDQDDDTSDDFIDKKENTVVSIIIKVVLFLVLVAVITAVIYFVINS